MLLNKREGISKLLKKGLLGMQKMLELLRGKVRNRML
jgi:hypothetical protein